MSQSQVYSDEKTSKMKIPIPFFSFVIEAMKIAIHWVVEILSIGLLTRDSKCKTIKCDCLAIVICTFEENSLNCKLHCTWMGSLAYLFFQGKACC